MPFLEAIAFWDNDRLSDLHKAYHQGYADCLEATRKIVANAHLAQTMKIIVTTDELDRLKQEFSDEDC